MKIFYIRTPKVGSTSLIESLKSSSLSCAVININNLQRDFSEKDIVVCASGLYKRYNLLLQKKYYNFEKICIVRNPVAKLVSAWKYCKSTNNRPIASCLKNPPKKKENPHDWGHFTRSQTGGLIYNGKKQYDKIFKHENYIEIINYLTEVFNTDLNIKHKNVGDSRKIILNEDELKMIYRIYKDDFINFDYPKPF